MLPICLRPLIPSCSSVRGILTVSENLLLGERSVSFSPILNVHVIPVFGEVLARLFAVVVHISVANVCPCLLDGVVDTFWFGRHFSRFRFQKKDGGGRVVSQQLVRCFPHFLAWQDLL